MKECDRETSHISSKLHMIYIYMFFKYSPSKQRNSMECKIRKAKDFIYNEKYIIRYKESRSTEFNKHSKQGCAFS
jgi:hypothetical protein